MSVVASRAKPRQKVPVAGSGVVEYRAETVHSRRWRRSKFLTVVLPSVLSLAAGLAIWTFVAEVLFAGRSFLLPSPWVVLTESLLNPEQLWTMIVALGATAWVAVMGLVFSFVVAIVTAVLMNQTVIFERMIYPYAVILQTIPILALIPLIGMLFGYGTESRVIICVLVATFPLIANTLFGLQSVEPGLHDLFTMRRATRAERLFLLQFPAALPSIFTGLRTASALAVVGAIVSDMYFTQGTPGIGTLLRIYTSTLQTADLFGAIVLASAFGMVVFWFFAALSDWVVGSWHVSGSKIRG
jgi:NitT/TauT family transport system permease protein